MQKIRSCHYHTTKRREFENQVQQVLELSRFPGHSYNIATSLLYISRHNLYLGVYKKLRISKSQNDLQFGMEGVLLGIGDWIGFLVEMLDYHILYYCEDLAFVCYK